MVGALALDGNLRWTVRRGPAAMPIGSGRTDDQRNPGPFAADLRN